MVNLTAEDVDHRVSNLDMRPPKAQYDKIWDISFNSFVEVYSYYHLSLPLPRNDVTGLTGSPTGCSATPSRDQFIYNDMALATVFKPQDDMN